MGAARPGLLICGVALLLAACTAGAPPHAGPSVAPDTSPTVATSPVATSPVAISPAVVPTVTHPRAPAAAKAPVHYPSAAAEESRLPLTFATADATQVITVVAPSTASTTGVLQAWQRSTSGWSEVGSALTAYLGTAGMSWHPSEATSATPIGSFTLTQAFGHDPNPGTALPYRQTTPADWWISQPGPLYNTLQHCATSCSFTAGDPNEHLYYEMPYYTYAVVIDYNRSPVVQGAGSAFFLHVTVGQPTQGCVSIPLASLASLMRWLKPAAHPRILIGVGG